MMEKVRRNEILDYVTYTEQRVEIRDEALAAKNARRVQVGDALTFLFENHTTVRYQILEMLRVEQIVKEAEIQHEIDTYNELLGVDGAVGCTLLIGIDDPAERDIKLRAWLDLPKHIHAELEDGSRVSATYDVRQVGEDRVSSVQFLHFPVGGTVPVAIVVDHPELTARTELSDAQRAALTADLAS